MSEQPALDPFLLEECRGDGCTTKIFYGVLHDEHGDLVLKAGKRTLVPLELKAPCYRLVPGTTHVVRDKFVAVNHYATCTAVRKGWKP